MCVHKVAFTHSASDLNCRYRLLCLPLFTVKMCKIFEKHIYHMSGSKLYLRSSNNPPLASRQPQITKLRLYKSQ